MVLSCSIMILSWFYCYFHILKLKNKLFLSYYIVNIFKFDFVVSFPTPGYKDTNSQFPNKSLWQSKSIVPMPQIQLPAFIFSRRQ